MQPISRPERLIPLLAGLQAFGPLSVDMYLPALPQLALDLNTTPSTAQLSISAFLIGLFLGMIFYGPMSDKYGRRQLLLGGMVLYLVATVGCFLATTAETLVVARFIQALGAASASVLGRTIVRDIFTLNDAARALSLMHLVTMIAALLAPIAASYLLLFGSWRWLFVILMAFSSLLLLLTIWKLPETHYGSSRGSSILSVFKTYATIARERVAIGYILCMSLCFAGMFAYITVSSFVFVNFFGVSPQFYAMLFGLNVLGVMSLVILNARLVRKVGMQTMLYVGGGICVASGLLLISSGVWHLGGMWLMVIGCAGHMSCTGLLGANCTATLMTLYKDNAGAAAGLAIAVQFGLGALFSTLISRLHDGTPLMMTLVVGGCGIASGFALLLTRTRAHKPHYG